MSLGWKLWCACAPLLVLFGLRLWPPQAPATATVAVLDRDAIVIKLSAELGTDRAIQQADAIAARLSQQGYIVLDHRYVLAAPSAQTVRP
ncbi:hypothetical protein [Ahniella affigens]|uniref:hypothetical protein n=1 Tax=Ahniella affigens TaxID=2021234 RepID=UPI0014757206|nr:hypothetical protein [Ahniella affigens]